MGKTAKNIAFILGLATVAFGGYYLYTQMESSSSFSSNEQNMQNMLNNTRVFIERGNILNNMDLDLTILEDDSFDSLQSYTRPIQPQTVGSRPNPFSEALSSSNTNLISEEEVIISD